MRFKRGEGKYWLLASIILGLLVAGILIFFIFNAYFSEDDINFETCRESIILRANSPEVKVWGFSFASFKDKFPLKCKTEIVEITKKDIEEKEVIGEVIENKAHKKIGEAMVSCWALFGNGDLKIFPEVNVGEKSYCVPCARIHLTEEAKDSLKKSGEVLDIEKILKTEFFRGVPYLNYLNGVGKISSPFSIANSRPFNLGGDSFKLDGKDRVPFNYLNKKTNKRGEDRSIGRVDLPKIFKIDEGDLLIVFNQRDIENYREIIDPVSHLFYFQLDQANDPFEEEMGKDAHTKGITPMASFGGDFCNEWDGIPA